MYTTTTNVFTVFIIIALIKYLSDLKITFTLKETLYLGFIGVFRSVITISLNRAIELFIYYSMLILFIYFYYTIENNNNKTKKYNYDILVNFFILYVFGILIDSVIGYSFFISSSFSSEVIVRNVPQYLVNSLIILLSMLLFSICLKKYKHKFTLNSIKIDNIKMLIFYLIFLFFNISLLVYQIIIVEQDIELYFKLIFTYLAYGLFMGSIILLMLRNIKLEMDAKNKLKLYSEITENSIEEIKAYKHDQKNVLSTLKEFIDTDNINSLRNYFYSQIYNDVPDVNNKEFLELSKVKNFPLKGLLISKLTRAKNHNINVDLMISNNIVDLVMKEVDFCRIFGILFDNAIEEASKTSEKNISLGIMSNSNNIYYILSNSLTYKPDCKKIFEKNISSKGKNRGLGLYNVKKILSKYKGCRINTFVDNNMFFQEIECNYIIKEQSSFTDNFKNKLFINNIKTNKIS